MKNKKITYKYEIVREFAEACTGLWDSVTISGLTNILKKIDEKYNTSLSLSYRQMEEHEQLDFISSVETANLTEDDYNNINLSMYRDLLTLLQSQKPNKTAGKTAIDYITGASLNVDYYVIDSDNEQITLSAYDIDGAKHMVDYIIPEGERDDEIFSPEEQQKIKVMKANHGIVKDLIVYVEDNATKFTI